MWELRSRRGACKQSYLASLHVLIWHSVCCPAALLNCFRLTVRCVVPFGVVIGGGCLPSPFFLFSFLHFPLPLGFPQAKGEQNAVARVAAASLLDLSFLFLYSILTRRGLCSLAFGAYVLVSSSFSYFLGSLVHGLPYWGAVAVGRWVAGTAGLINAESISIN